jgi:flagellar hook-associated protein 2
MSLSTGLISGMDTGSLISQLIQAEAAPQTALKTRLAATQTAASAYRTVNTTFAAVRAAAEALTTGSLADGRKATASGDAGVTVSASASSVAGTSLTFTPTALADTHIVLSNSEWTSTTGSVRDQEPGWPIEIRKADGTTVVGTIDVAPGASLAEAVKAINDSTYGVKATIVSLSPTKHRLQLVSTVPGEAGQFIVKSANETEAAAGSGFTATKTGQDATLDLGNGVVATSSTNTFTDLMPGVTVTISKTGISATISVASDQDAVAAKMQTLVDAVNSSLSNVKTYTSNAKGSTAALKGDYSVTSLGSALLTAISEAVEGVATDGTDRSPAVLGLQLTRDGKVTFDKAKFTAALKETPELAQAMVGGRVAGVGADGVAGGTDDVTAVTGIAQKLLAVAKNASDSATGSLVALANGQDSLVKTYEDRIAAWDLRLAKRKETLTRQFTAMETALSSLRNQSTWLAGQINSLPSSS